MLAQKHKRKSYSFEVKLRAIALAEEKGNRVGAREFEVDESMIRDWRKKKPQMKKLPKHQRTCRGGKAKFPAPRESPKGLGYLSGNPAVNTSEPRRLCWWAKLVSSVHAKKPSTFFKILWSQTYC